MKARKRIFDFTALQPALTFSAKKRGFVFEGMEADWRSYHTLETLELDEDNFQTFSNGPYYFSDDPSLNFIWGFGVFQT